MKKLSLFLALGFAVSMISVQAQTTFGGPHVIVGSAVTYGPKSVFPTDIDGDGDMDVISASDNDNKIAWYENTDGMGTFGKQKVITANAMGACSVFSADLDGDGDMDVLSASGLDNKIVWYENTDGSGTFGMQEDIAIETNNPSSVYSADLDGDGDMDVLSASFGDNKIAWYENTDGDGIFGDQQVITTEAHHARSVYSADIDGDGDMDVLSASFQDNKIAWYENTDGSGTFGTQQIISTVTSGANSVYCSDLDGDGDLDVLSASTFLDINNIAWYENTDGLGTFGTQQVITTDALGSSSVYSADIDGDGDMDVLSASFLDDKLVWYNNTDGLGTFGIHTVITNTADAAIAVCCADFDGDDDMDILSICANDQIIVWYENTDGEGLFGVQQFITTSANGSCSVHSADFDGDGDADVLSASRLDNNVTWFENIDGNGTFMAKQIINTFATGVNTIYSADLDGDGDLDVLSASSIEDTLAWYENTDGYGTFGPQQIISDPSDGEGVRSVYTADLDGDGDMDVLSAFLFGSLGWYENTDGIGTFGPRQLLYGTGTVIYSADLDGDGDMDVLAASSWDDQIFWFENTDGSGTFEDFQIISTHAYGVQSVSCSDIDGDGDLDVLSASADDDRIEWYENTDGSGYFGFQQVITSAADGAQSVYSADLDNDGDMDVISASSEDDKIAWYENTDGAGTFGIQLVISSDALHAVSVFCADINGDGALDVLSASEWDSKIAWYENNLETSIETVNQNGISTYPNPTSSFITIDNEQLTINEIEIMDITGKVVLKSSNDITSKTSIRIDLSGFENGIYLISIQTENEVFTEMIIRE